MKATTQVLDLPNFRTEIRRYGQGPTLVLIQGGGTGKNAWNALVDRLGSAVACVAYDNRGVGMASDVGESLSIEDLALDAAMVIEALGEGAVHVAGVSLGGFIAMRLAVARPDLVTTLTLHATSARLNSRSIAQGDFRRRLIELRLPDTAALLRDYVAPWAAGARGLLRELPGDVVSHNTEFSEHNFLGHMRAIREHDMRADELATITTPTLIVAGAEDILCPLEDARFLNRNIPESKLVVLERSGHIYYHEDPELTAVIQGGWIAQHS